MRRFIAPAILVTIVATANWAIAQQPAAKSPYTLKVDADRPDALYKLGEQAKFMIRLTRDGKAMPGIELSYTFSLDGYRQIKEGKLTTSEEAVSVAGSLDAPGILRLQVTCKPEGQQPIMATAAAGFDPLAIKPSLAVPDDFDAFWKEQKQMLASVPMNPRLTPVDSPVKEVECFDVQVDCLGGKPVSGYFARPKGAKPKSLPAVLFVHGAGVRSSVLGTASYEAKRGRLAMDMNAHGITNGQPQKFYGDLAAGELRDYRAAGRESRETCYFRGMFLRLVRGLDFLCSQPEWDGRILIVRGGSQGGGQALAAAGLDSRVTALFAAVPALCDHSGNAVDRVAGWPKLVPLKADKQPDAQVLQAARYFDGMNFATRTQADAIVSVGFIDATCPPTAVYATHNNLPGRKQMVTGVLVGHTVTPEATAAADAFLDEHIARVQAARTEPSGSPSTGQSQEKKSPDDQYVPGPDSLEQPGVPKGEVTKYSWNDSKIFPGTVRDYWVYVPKQYDPKKPACVFVCQDRILYNAATVFDNLIHKKEMPVTIGIFIEPGDVPLKPGEPPRKRPDGRPAPRANRSVEYDTLSDSYSRFLLEEILPAVGKQYNLTDKPEGRCIAGSSSGGICAFTVCWERPDAFRKCFTTVGSFTNIRGGNKYPELVRSAPKKPIRIYQQDGANDIVNQFGSWPEANMAMAAALNEKGYDHKFVFGEGVHSAKHGTAIFPEAMRWMWRDWPKE